jgi:5-methylcytosine-specific restriction endonuclease McrA
MTIARSTHEKLCRAQALLGHQIPSGDLAQVLDRILDLAIAQLEKQKFGATAKPRRGHRRSAPGSRHIPDAVRREVWERDGGQCSFVSEDGRRCQATRSLEFDHIVEFARGGEATADGIRLLCRAHNQHHAECTFGSEFMRHKRIAASEFRAAARARAEKKAHARAAAKVHQEEPAHVQEVIPCMRALGYRPGEARDAARLCTDMPDARSSSAYGSR